MPRKIGKYKMEFGLLSDTGGVTLDLHAAMGDPGKMHKRSDLTNGSLLHRCELVKKIPKLLRPEIHAWVKIFARRPGWRIRDVSGNRSHAVSVGITQTPF